LWDLTTGRRRGGPRPAGSWVRGLAFSPDGTRLALATAEDGQLWDVASGEVRLRFKATGGRDSLQAVAFTPDGRQVLLGGSGGRPILWDVAGGGGARALQGVGWIDVVACSPDGRLIAAGGLRGAVFVWDARGNSVGQLSHPGGVQGLAFSPD